MLPVYERPGMRLQFSKLKGKIQIDKRDDSDALIARRASKFETDEDFAKMAAELGVDKILLRQAIDKYEQHGHEGNGACTLVVKQDFCVHIRPLAGQHSGTFSGTSMLDALKQALAATDLELDEPILYWDSPDYLAALDLDVMPGQEFDNLKLLGLDSIPIPAVSWVTRSGGLRLIYTNFGAFTAEEVAAVAYLCLIQSGTYRGIEIKTDTRHPCYVSANGTSSSEVMFRSQDFNPSHLRRWLRMYSASDSEVTDWLAERGMELGGRYDHNQCPVDPGRESRGAKPVQVLDKGVFCFSCEAHGLTAGSSKPGFFPYSYLCGSSASTMLYKCMENAVHLEQAKYVLESKLGLTGRYARLVYSAGMLLHGWNREVIKAAERVGSNLVRMSDRWVNLNGEPYTKDIKPLLATLPACCNISADKMTPNRAKIAVFDQNFDLAVYGYPSIQPIYGLQIWGQHIKSEEERDITAVIQVRDLSDESMVKFRPCYRPPDKRPMSEPEAWQVIERAFPGICRPFLRLLIAARGIRDGGISMPPIIFVTGPTGGGKSLTVFLAASICGDSNTEVIWTPNIERLRQAIVDAKGSYVTFNEVLKESARQTKNAASSMDFILNLTPDSVSHSLYVGPVRLGRLPVMVLTDTALPSQVKQDAQLARRLVHVQLLSAVDWEQSLKFCGIGHPSKFRWKTEQNAEACNTIVSSVIDEFFSEPTTFEDIVEKLGFTKLSKSDEASEGRDTLRYFFDSVCRAPALDGANAIRWKGHGWKLIRKDNDTELRTAWQGVCDSDEQFTSSRRCSEVDWQKLLGSTEPVNFEFRTHGMSAIVVRFRSGAGDAARYNADILKPQE
jgi:hypothetical protein